MKFLSTMFVLPLFTVLLLVGCAARQSPKPIPEFSPNMSDSSDYLSTVDNFLIILDASSSMDARYEGNKKFVIAREIVNRLSQTLPEMGQNAGLRSFGHSPKVSDRSTVLFYGMEKYTQKNLTNVFEVVSSAGGTSPMHMALTEAGEDLNNYPGKTAVIIISDGQEAMGLESPKTLKTAQELKDHFGPGLCFYPVFVGDDENGMVLMDGLARIGECGYVSNADTLLTEGGMAAFVKDIFLTKKPVAPKDSDNDGVTDDLDKCPGTPKGVEVDVDGCPLVVSTPPVVKAAAPQMMETLNSQGAWVVGEAYFAFDKSVVTPKAFDFLDKIVEFLEAFPDVFIKIQGHTDNVGTKAYNDVLSLQRAQAVKTYLTDRGIDKSRLACEGLGFSKPIAANKTDKDRAKNRRVELYPVIK